MTIRPPGHRDKCLPATRRCLPPGLPPHLQWTAPRNGPALLERQYSLIPPSSHECQFPPLLAIPLKDRQMLLHIGESSFQERELGKPGQELLLVNTIGSSADKGAPRERVFTRFQQNPAI